MKNESKLQELKARVEEGVKLRWGTPSEEVTARIKEELAVIEAVGCVDYFLMAAGLVDAIRSAGGLVGPGRGTCGSSAVCYALRISGVDPIKHGLLFERFLHRGLKHPRPILIDVDDIGEKTGKAYLAGRYVCTYEKREHRIMPQFVQIGGYGEIGLTRIFELDRMAEVLRKMRSGENGADILDELTDDCSPCAVGCGVLQYEEDVVLAGQKEAKLGVVESDAFRKAICMRLRDKAEKYKPLFSEDRWNELWNAGINLRIKAHCVCETRLYAMMAYFKIRYPGQWIR